METTTAEDRTTAVGKYPCTVPGCTRSYTSKPNLRGHLRTNHGIEGDFKCDVEGCNKGYNGGVFTSDTLQGMNLHKALWHGEGKKKRKSKGKPAPPRPRYQANGSQPKQSKVEINFCPACGFDHRVLRAAMNFVP